MCSLGTRWTEITSPILMVNRYALQISKTLANNKFLLPICAVYYVINSACIMHSSTPTRAPRCFKAWFCCYCSPLYLLLLPIIFTTWSSPAHDSIHPGGRASGLSNIHILVFVLLIWWSWSYPSPDLGLFHNLLKMQNSVTG